MNEVPASIVSRIKRDDRPARCCHSAHNAEDEIFEGVMYRAGIIEIPLSDTLSNKENISESRLLVDGVCKKIKPSTS